MLTKHLSLQLEEAVLYDDVPLIQQILWQWKSNASEHGYALVVLQDKTIIGSTFLDGVPIGLVEANLPSGSHHQLRRVLNGAEAYLDVSVPLIEGAAGWVRLGLYEEPVRAPERKILIILLGMILFFILLGVIGAIIISRMITSPIEKIMSIISTVDLNSEPVSFDIHTGDELEILAASFEEMTKRLQQSHKQLSEANRKGFEAQKLAALGLLASGIAHEINNPLTGIELGIKRIAKDPKNSVQILRYLPPMLDSLEHMQHVVRQTLLFAKPEPLKFSTVSLLEIIEHALVLVHHKLGKQSINVIKVFEKERTRVWTDPQSLTQILVNLIMNAADAMPIGGDLIIKTARHAGFIHIIITDTGCGIERENMEKVWEPFFSTKEIGEGTGLGLSVTRTLVNNLSGTIAFESEVDKGTSFRVSLPINRSEER